MKARPSRWATTNIGRSPTCWSKWPSVTASRYSCRKRALKGSAKPSWLHYVCSEVRDAMGRGADIRGICWYPITAYPGWDNSRHAETGLLSTIVGGRQPSRRRAAARGDRGSARAVRLRPGDVRSPGPPGLGNRRGLGFIGRCADEGPASRHSMRSISRIRRLLISSSCR